ncbi:MAG: hypothetical protein Ct9H300mP16_19690 [Pseudomonadota bacterium]|nr:MAG: hypothetical protein Ct9H300mP16_19690 [Pseudomonadota bacterium]
MYYLTGYESFGYCFFQCMVRGLDGPLALLPRSRTCARPGNFCFDDARDLGGRRRRSPAQHSRTCSMPWVAGLSAGDRT